MMDESSQNGHQLEVSATCDNTPVNISPSMQNAENIIKDFSRNQITQDENQHDDTGQQIDEPMDDGVENDVSLQDQINEQSETELNDHTQFPNESDQSHLLFGTSAVSEITTEEAQSDELLNSSKEPLVEEPADDCHQHNQESEVDVLDNVTHPEENEEASTPIVKETAAGTPLVEEMAASTPLEEMEASTPLVEEMETNTPLVEEMAASTPLVEEMEANTPLVEEMAASTPLVEEMAACTPLVEDMTANTFVEETAASTPLAEEMPHSASLSQTNIISDDQSKIEFPEDDLKNDKSGSIDDNNDELFAENASIKNDNISNQEEDETLEKTESIQKPEEEQKSQSSNPESEKQVLDDQQVTDEAHFETESFDSQDKNLKIEEAELVPIESENIGESQELEVINAKTPKIGRGRGRPGKSPATDPGAEAYHSRPTRSNRHSTADVESANRRSMRQFGNSTLATAPSTPKVRFGRKRTSSLSASNSNKRSKNEEIEQNDKEMEPDVEKDKVKDISRRSMRHKKPSIVTLEQFSDDEMNVKEMQVKPRATRGSGRSSPLSKTPVKQIHASRKTPQSSASAKTKKSTAQTEIGDDYDFDDNPTVEVIHGSHGTVQFKPSDLSPAGTDKPRYGSLFNRIGIKPSEENKSPIQKPLKTPIYASKPRTPVIEPVENAKTPTSRSSSSKHSRTPRSSTRKGLPTLTDMKDNDDDYQDDVTPQSSRGRGRGRVVRASTSASASGSPAPLPPLSTSRYGGRAKAKPEIPVLSAQDQNYSDSIHKTNETHTHLADGCRVYALYGREYYPAMTLKRIDINQYETIFVQDEIVKKCTRGNMIPLVELQEGCTLEAAESDTEIYETVIVEKVPSTKDVNEWQAANYECSIEEDGKNVRRRSYNWASFMITKQQASQFKEAAHDESTTVVDKDNVLEGPTPRRLRQAAKATMQNVIDSKHRPDSNQKPALQSAQSMKTVTPVKKAPKKLTSPVNVPAPKLQPPNSKSKLDVKIIDCPRDMFKGYYFVLTSSTNRERDITSKPFEKRVIKYYITTLGGNVVETFKIDDGSEMAAALKENKVFCVTDAYYRTTKFLMALACGARIVDHKWIHECIDEKKIQPLEKFLLPAGHDLDRDIIVEQKPPQKERQSPFGNDTYITFDNGKEPGSGEKGDITSDICPHLYRTWRPILEVTGHNHLLEFPEDCEKLPPGAKCFAIVDNMSDQSFLDRCERLNYPLVTSEWLITCLIYQERVAHDNSVRYVPSKTISTP